MPLDSGVTAGLVIYGASILGSVFAASNALATRKTRTSKGLTKKSDHGVQLSLNAGSQTGLLEDDVSTQQETDALKISGLITRGARAFLRQEYTYLAMTMAVFSVLIFLLLSVIKKDSERAIFASIAYLCGGATSASAGYIGMEIATFANVATTLAGRDRSGNGYTHAFKTAFKAGGVMGFSLVSMGLSSLFSVILVFMFRWPNAGLEGFQEDTIALIEAVAGFGLGGSTVALFGRVGGGIYTKAADVGADLVGKTEFKMEEDDPKNPAVIADNVGDNVGDIAGMGADLFGSFASSCCATMLIAAQSPELSASRIAMVLPLVVYSAGLVVNFFVSFVATHLSSVTAKNQIERTLKIQVMLSTVIMTPVIWIVVMGVLPAEFEVKYLDYPVQSWSIVLCLWSGLWSGLIMGSVTEYYTSSHFAPVVELSESCVSGAATNIIYGLSLGYKSVVIPVMVVTLSILVNFSLAGEYGVAMGAIGILSTLATELSIDAYGPICDNAGGIAEMAHFPSRISDVLDDLDAAGNTTAAVGKGFAIGSATFVSLALFGAFITSADLDHIDLHDNLTFAGLLLGAMLPYWFTAMTMKSVGKAAIEMVEEVRRQLSENYDAIMAGTDEPDYDRCIEISTQSSLKEMVPPGLMVLLFPLFVGFFISPRCLAGLLVGNLVSGIQMAISQSNTGGAWDNAKKYIEAGGLGPGKGKNSPEHTAAVIGDTVGDPLKDTSGPAINILIKITAILSVVCAPAMPQEGIITHFFKWATGYSD